MKNAISFFIFIVVLLIFVGCKKNKNSSSDEYFYLYCNYTYYTGQAPTFNVVSASDGVSYGDDTLSVISVGTDNHVRIRISKIRIVKNQENYDVNSFEIDESKKYNNNIQSINDNDWAAQQEFQKYDSTIKNKLAVAMVLDFSSSLTTKVNSIKSSANDFINNLLGGSASTYGTNSNGNNGYLGLVLFSKTITTTNFSTNISALQTVVNSYTDFEDYTSLYGAMDTGLYMLDTFTHQPVDAKILITFTDGRDNYTNNPTIIKNHITNSALDRYVIGLRGGSDYDEDILKSLASSDKFFYGANDVNGVSDAFNDILKKLSTMVTIQYDRTDQLFTPGIDNPVQIRIKIKATKRQ